MLIPARLLVHTVTVKPYQGESSNGPVYGATFTLPCMAQGKRRMVRTPTGTEALSTLTLFAALADAPRIPAGSEVTWRDDTTTVLATIAHDDGGLGTPQHTEVACE